jgi:type I restriction enzyme S subunit
MPELAMRPEELAIVRAILARHVPGVEVWAFGSRARGIAKPYSDLDLAIIAELPLSLEQGAALAEAFAESDLPWRVDVVEWTATSEAFRAIIERDHLTIQAASHA